VTVGGGLVPRGQPAADDHRQEVVDHPHARRGQRAAPGDRAVPQTRRDQTGREDTQDIRARRQVVRWVL
jgi:hypothetical protein